MSELTTDNVRYIAALGRVHLSDGEIETFTSHLAQVIGYVDQLAELNVDGVEPTSHVLHIKDVFREDIVRPSLKPSDAMSIAVDSTQGFFKVPRVIE